MFDFNPKDGGIEIKVKARRLDATNSERFRAEFEEYCTEPLEYASINLSETEFIDSSGIGALLSVHHRMRDAKQHIKILDPQPAITSIIELMRLQRIFDIEKAKTE